MVDRALGYFQRASQRRGVRIVWLTTQPDIYVRDKRTDEAAELIARAGQINRKDPRVLLEEAMLSRLRGQIHDAESRFRELLANPASGVPVRVRALYDLASLLDSEGQYDE